MTFESICPETPILENIFPETYQSHLPTQLAAQAPRPRQPGSLGLLPSPALLTGPSLWCSVTAETWRTD